MSNILSEKEHNVNITIDSRYANSGNWSDFIVTGVFTNQISKLKRIGVYFVAGLLPANNMNILNNTISVAIGNNNQIHNMTFITGRYNRSNSPPTPQLSYPNVLQTILNTNVFGAVFNVTFNANTGNYTITCTQPFRFTNIRIEHSATFGLFNMNSFESALITRFTTFFYSPNVYVCSKALTRFSNTSISNIPNIGDVIAVFRFTNLNNIGNSEYYNNVETTTIWSRFTESAPIGPLDITLRDEFGNKYSSVFEGNLTDGGYLVLQLLAVSSTT